MDRRLEDFRASAELLLDAPVISSAINRDMHQLVRRNIGPLNAWFADRAGWRIQDHPEFVRLVKPPARAETAHAVEWARDRLDYELFAWVLWYYEHIAGRRFTLSQLADEIRDRSARHGDAFEWRKLSERRRLVRILDAISQMGVIRIRDGSLTEWQDEVGKQNALCEWGALAWQIHVGLSHDVLNRLAVGDEQERTLVDRGPTARMRAYRQVLLGPALFRFEDPEAFAHITSAPEALRDFVLDVAKHTGWEVEHTPAYVRVLRPAGRSESMRPPVPTDGSLAHVMILLCGAIRRLRLRGDITSAGDDFFTVTTAQIELLLSEIHDEHAERWKKDFRTAPAGRLWGWVAPEMKRWGLLRGPNEGGNYLVTPLVGRLDGVYTTNLDEE
jgi:uncharacterized protein (TIGR02678 family)